MILLANQKLQNVRIAKIVGAERRSVGRWRRRWQESFDALLAIEHNEPRAALERAIVDILRDAHRSGSPGKFSAEQIVQAARELMVDHARRRKAAKRGGGWNRISLSGVQDDRIAERVIDVIDLEEALEQLGAISPRQEQIVEMRFYAGLTIAEIAEVFKVSERTIAYDWRMARAWLRTRLEDQQE